MTSFAVPGVAQLLGYLATSPDHTLLNAIDTVGKVTLVLALAAALSLGMRRRAAATRHRVWTVAVAMLCVLPVAAVLAPSWSLPLPPLVLPVGRWGAPTIALIGEATSHTGPGPQGDDRPATATHDTASARHRRLAAPSVGHALFSRRAVLASLIVVWLLGAVAGIIRLLADVAALRRMIPRTRAVHDPEWLRLMAQIARDLAIRRPVALRVAGRGATPVTWGVIRPVVALPADAATWSPEWRHAVLLHELAHVARWDTLTQGIAQLAHAVFWFHPLAALAVQRLRVERERACDDVVLAAGTSATMYATELLSLVQSVPPCRRVVAIATAHASDFEGRVQAILDPAQPRTHSSRPAIMAIGSAALCATVPLAGFRVLVTVGDRNAAALAASSPVPRARAPSGPLWRPRAGYVGSRAR